MNRARPPIAIIGQGIAGTALGLALEERGLEFVIFADAHGDAASRVAAGLINPVTGQRFVRNWRIGDLLPLARRAYACWEERLGVKVWHDVEIERRFTNAVERERAQRKFESGELKPFFAAIDADKVSISGAAWVDLPAMMKRARERWIAAGKLVESRVGPELVPVRTSRSGIGHDARLAPTILCVGAGDLVAKYFPELSAVPVKGEIIAIDGEGFDVSRVLHDGMWVRPESPTRARVGATFEPGVNDRMPTDAARDRLMEAAGRLFAHRSCTLSGHEAGVRLAASDRLPVAGWSAIDQGVGMLGALGSKGALWAPWLAQMWAEHLAHSSSFDPVVSSQRFAGRGSAVE